MYHKELFICISASTTASFFSSLAKIRKCSAQMPSQLSDSHESVVKSKYKSPLYKLWQYATKNKPSLYNDGAIHYKDKNYRQVQRIFTSCECSLKFFLQLENYIKQATSTEFRRSSLLKSHIFLYYFNNIGWRSLPYFISDINLIPWIFTYARDLLRKEKSNNYKDFSKLNNFVLQIYNIKRQRQKTPSRIGIYIDKILHNKVYC